MGCGLCYAPGTFQSAMNHVLRGLTWFSTLYQECPQLHLRRMLSSNDKHQKTILLELDDSLVFKFLYDVVEFTLNMIAR